MVTRLQSGEPEVITVGWTTASGAGTDSGVAVVPFAARFFFFSFSCFGVCEIVWSGVCGMVWCSMVRYSAMRSSAVGCGKVGRCVVWCVVQCGVVWCGLGSVLF